MSLQVEAYRGFTIIENERNDEEGYIETLNDIYGDIQVCGLEYPAADVLRAVDPIAYDCGFADYQEVYYTIESPDTDTFDNEEYESIDEATGAIDDYYDSLIEDDKETEE